MSDADRIGDARSLRRRLETEPAVRDRLLAVANGNAKAVDRAIAMACLAVAQSMQRSALEACSFGSVVQCCMSALELGLALGDPIRSEAYLIPFAGECKLMPGYRGLLKLARQSGEIESVVANPVCQGDEFWIDHSRTPPYSHRPDWGATPTRDRVLGFYAAVRWRSGAIEIHWMTRAEVDAVAAGVEKKNKGKMPELWKFHYIPAGCKTVIRRAMRYAPLTAAAERVMHESESIDEIETAQPLPLGHALLAASARSDAEPSRPAAAREAAPAPAGAAAIDAVGRAMGLPPIDADEIDRLADEPMRFGGNGA